MVGGNKIYLIKKKSEGITRSILVSTVICLILWSCLVLEAQINREVFIQFGLHGYTMNFSHCFLLAVTYCVYFAPMTIYWIVNGFREDENNKYT